MSNIEDNLGKTGFSGLSTGEVTESRNRFGSNVITPPKREPLWKLFLKKFEDPIIRILLIAAFLSFGISFVHGEYIETLGIFFAIFLATGVGFWFEMDANKKFDILNKVNDETPVKVVRDGSVKEVQKSELVCGDFVILDTGEEVPADGELYESVSLYVNESTLTGEPVTAKSSDPALIEKETTYPSNKIYRGTTVVEGHCTFIVTEVGDNTEFGKVAEKSAERSEEQTPLNKQLESLAGFIGFAGLITAFSLFAILYVKEMFSSSLTAPQITLLTSAIAGLIAAIGKIWLPILRYGSKKERRERSWLYWSLLGLALFIIPTVIAQLLGVDVLNSKALVSIEIAGRVLGHFMVAVTLIVVAVPEGLPMAVTLSLAMSMRRMLLSNNLVRKMHATETMGATTVICTDKTGTLTMNQMRVSEAIIYGSERLFTEGMAVNSTAFLDTTDPSKPKALGNPTEAALLLWLNDKGEDYLKIRESVITESQITFSTERKFMATLVKFRSTGRRVLFLKGAPEIVASKCKSVPEDISQRLAHFQSRAMRTLAFASTEVDMSDKRSPEELISDGLEYIGAVAISDPVRADVPEAVARCARAGIAVKIVTGDTIATAVEIGRQIGVLGREESTEGKVLSGGEFAEMGDEEAYNAVADMRIMCRARPSDKQRLVQLLQKRGEVVAVTGDGTNDAPALNHAHVGLSMGTGTSVAKEASDITLLDDSFSSIATAVMWGRSLYRNIQRFIIFQLTINLTAMVIVLLGTLLGHQLPLTVTQMLWVNLIMDTFAAGALASLPPEESVMKESPRNSSSFIITPAMRMNIILTSSLFVVALIWLMITWREGADALSRYHLSMFFTIFVMLQFWNLFNAKSFNSGGSAFRGLMKSPGFLFVSLIIVAGQVLIVQFGGDVFRTVPISFAHWMVIVAATSSVLWFGEAIRVIKRHLWQIK
ncbi:MAG: calcium-translocating P-type ATPase, PMCA-type [Bacteroidetes bacterium 41-46]|nr:MAG: calcium-translocating P-type ATPase, PMCA-type [Bacteroidetes bacterium 41-46]